MRYLVTVMSVAMTLHLTGCGIGGVWLEPSNAPREPAYPYGARWVKEGMTRESRKADWIACGGGPDLQDGFRKLVQPETWEFFWPQKEAHRKNLWECMNSKNYEYFIRGHEFEYPKLTGKASSCDARTCLYP